MRKTFALLVASTALTAAIGLPAWSAMRAAERDDSRPATLIDAEEAASPFLLASGDDDDDRRDDRRKNRSASDDDDDDDDEDDDDDDGGRRAANPAPAGTALPPKNGLFGNGATPKVTVN